MIQVMYTLLHEVQCNWRCIDGSSEEQITACSTVQLALCWCFKWCTSYCMMYSAHGGVLIVQVMYRLLYAVQWNWRCNDGASDIKIAACNTVQLVVYGWFKWSTDYCTPLDFCWCSIDGSKFVQINAWITVKLAVYCWFKWWTDYCM